MPVGSNVDEEGCSSSPLLEVIGDSGLGGREGGREGGRKDGRRGKGKGEDRKRDGGKKVKEEEKEG